MPKNLLLDKKKGEGFILSFSYKVILFIAFIILFFYAYRVLFGVRSAEVLMKLNKQEKELSSLIKMKKKENANMQKQLLEYKVLLPE